MIEILDSSSGLKKRDRQEILNPQILPVGSQSFI